MGSMLLVIVLLVFIIIYIFFRKKPQPAKETFGDSYNNCVCVFDIDNTLTCGNPYPYIEKCKENNCRIAINTARPSKYMEDLSPELVSYLNMNMTEDYYFNPNSYSQTREEVADIKSTYLGLLRDKYKVNKECVILLDDSRSNIETAKRNGFGVVKANNTRNNCGIPLDGIYQFENMIKNCISD